MPEITASHVREIANPKVRALGTRLYNVARLAAEKAVAHQSSPSIYPMPPEPKGMERLFLARLRSLRPQEQQANIAKTMTPSDWRDGMDSWNPDKVGEGYSSTQDFSGSKSFYQKQT
jgi:hypothetical protein